MSLFSGIKNVEHTFAAWAEKEWTVVYGAAPKIEQMADTVLKYVGPALSIAVTAEGGPAAGALVTGIVNTAQADLTAASGLISDFGPTPNAASIISTVQTNLGTLLTATGVKSDKAVSAVTKAVNSLAVLSTAITNAVNAASAPAQTPAAN